MIAEFMCLDADKVVAWHSEGAAEPMHVEHFVTGGSIVPAWAAALAEKFDLVVVAELSGGDTVTLVFTRRHAVVEGAARPRLDVSRAVAEKHAPVNYAALASFAADESLYRRRYDGVVYATQQQLLHEAADALDVVLAHTVVADGTRTVFLERRGWAAKVVECLGRWRDAADGDSTIITVDQEPTLPFAWAVDVADAAGLVAFTHGATGSDDARHTSVVVTFRRPASLQRGDDGMDATSPLSPTQQAVLRFAMQHADVSTPRSLPASFAAFDNTLLRSFVSAHNGGRCELDDGPPFRLRKLAASGVTKPVTAVAVTPASATVSASQMLMLETFSTNLFCAQRHFGNKQTADELKASRAAADALDVAVFEGIDGKLYLEHTRRARWLAGVQPMIAQWAATGNLQLRVQEYTTGDSIPADLKALCDELSLDCAVDAFWPAPQPAGSKQRYATMNVVVTRRAQAGADIDLESLRRFSADVCCADRVYGPRVDNQHVSALRVAATELGVTIEESTSMLHMRHKSRQFLLKFVPFLRRWYDDAAGPAELTVEALIMDGSGKTPPAIIEPMQNLGLSWKRRANRTVVGVQVVVDIVVARRGQSSVVSPAPAVVSPAPAADVAAVDIAMLTKFAEDLSCAYRVYGNRRGGNAALAALRQAAHPRGIKILEGGDALYLQHAMPDRWDKLEKVLQRWREDPAAQPRFVVDVAIEGAPEVPRAFYDVCNRLRVNWNKGDVTTVFGSRRVMKVVLHHSRRREDAPDAPTGVPPPQKPHRTEPYHAPNFVVPPPPVLARSGDVTRGAIDTELLSSLAADPLRGFCLYGRVQRQHSDGLRHRLRAECDRMQLTVVVAHDRDMTDVYVEHAPVARKADLEALLRLWMGDVAAPQQLTATFAEKAGGFKDNVVPWLAQLAFKLRFRFTNEKTRLYADVDGYTLTLRKRTGEGNAIAERLAEANRIVAHEVPPPPPPPQQQYRVPPVAAQAQPIAAAHIAPISGTVQLPPFGMPPFAPAQAPPAMMQAVTAVPETAIAASQHGSPADRAELYRRVMPPQAAMPPGWTSMISTRHGGTFVIDHMSRRAFRPPPGASAVDAAAALLAVAGPQSALPHL
jgi:hypothetical protein